MPLGYTVCQREIIQRPCGHLGSLVACGKMAPPGVESIRYIIILVTASNNSNNKQIRSRTFRKFLGITLKCPALLCFQQILRKCYSTTNPFHCTSHLILPICSIIRAFRSSTFHTPLKLSLSSHTIKAQFGSFKCDSVIQFLLKPQHTLLCTFPT